ALSILAFGAFLLFISWGVLTLLSNAELNEALQQAGAQVNLAETLVRLPELVFGGVFLAGILTTFGALLQTLYLSGDMEFLLAAPIPARAVFASKLLLAVLPGLLILGLLTIPALVGLGLSQGYNLLYFILVPLTLIMLLLSAAGLSSVLVMLVVRVLPPRRAAEVLGLIGGVVAVLFSQIGQFTNNIDNATIRLSGAMSFIDRASTPLNPLTWPGQGLTEIGQGNWSVGLLYTGVTLIATTTLVAFSLVFAERLYFSGWSKVQAGSISRKKPKDRRQKAEQTGEGSIFRRLLSAPVVAVIEKDFRMYRRDLRNLSQLVTPILFAVIWTFTLNRPSRNIPIPNEFSLPGGGMSFVEIGTVGIALFIGWMFAIRFAMGGISSEGKQWWIIKSSPLHTGHLLVAKFLIALIPTALLSLVYFAITSIYRGAEPGTLIYHSVVILLVTAAECSLLLAFGIWTARFDWDNPRQINSGIGGCFGTAATVIFIGVATGLFIGLPALTSFFGLAPLLGIIAGATAGLALCLAVGVAPIWMAQSRVQSLGEA
ncbi:MAG: hypothetical protein R3335_12895, partial [Anaerolineales bacterium]|nr:hypothetical protein [Anaerolineales bacterium]